MNPTDPKDIHEILRTLPHKYPFLLVDRVLECEPDTYVKALKNVTINEPFFQGHFPDRPIMPGVLLIEALAQATGLLAYYSNVDGLTPGDVFYLVGIDKARFKQTVEPGDQLILEATVLRKKRGIFVLDGKVSVDGKVVASAELMTTQADR